MTDKLEIGALGVETGAALKYSHVLGVKTMQSKSIEHLNDDAIAYMSGRHAAEFEIETCTHKFLLKAAKTVEITAFCVSPNRKYIALAEKLSDGTQVNVYTQNGSRVRTLEFKYLSKLPVISMDFSTDNKYLACVTSLPDVFVYLWQVDKSRLVGMADVSYELTRITISPWSYWSMCTTGPSSLRLWRLVEKQLKQVDPVPKKKDSAVFGSNRFTCHCWYDDEKVVSGTEEGDIMVVENAEVKRTIKSVHGEAYAITAISAVSRGFVCGGEGGFVSIFERTFDDQTYFRPLKRFTMPSSQQMIRVVDISIAPKEETAVILFANNTISTLSLEVSATTDVVAAGTTADSTAKDSAAFRPIPIGFHSDIITCVDICVQKAFVVTGSLDKTIRLWNFVRRRMEFIKTFDEEVLSLALHPTGLRILVGFKSYLRMYNVLANDLHFCMEFPIKPCHEVRFSTGGQYFAAVVAHRILIFNTYDFQCIAQLSGHAVMIRSVCWSKNDQILTSADMNGIAYSWQISTQKRVDIDDVRKNVSYNCVRYDDTTQSVAVIGACRVAEGGAAEGEISIRCIVPDQEPRITHPGLMTLKPPSQKKQHSCELAISSLAQTMFVGMPNGSVYLYSYPLVEDAQPYQTLEVHQGEVTFVMLSADERYLFTVGEDNSLFMFDVDAVSEGRSVSRKPQNYSMFDDVCYVLHSEVDDKVRELAALQQELEDLQTAKRHDESNLTQRFEHERATLEKQTTTQITSLSRQLEQAQTGKGEAEKALTENARQLESMHLKAAEELEALYTRRTEESNARYLQLKTERDDLIVRYENKLFKMQKEHEAERRNIDDKGKEMEQKLRMQIDQLKARLSSDSAVNDGMLDQTIADYEIMLDELHAKYKGVIAKKEEDLSRAINNSSTGERDSDRLRREKAALLQQLKEREGQIGELQVALEKRKKENESLRKEMLVRFESISTAEKKIQQLKKQTTELEKLRYVLTFKFNELKKEVAPKEKQIDFMTTRVEAMDSELEKVALDREQLKQIVDQRDDKLKVLQREIASHRRGLDDKERVIHQLLRELTELIQNGGTKQLVYQVKDLITRFQDKSQREQATSAEEGKTAEFERQREYMESQLQAISRQNLQKESNLRLDNQRNTAENAILVKEINELRHERKLLATKCQIVEGQLKEARAALQRATAAHNVEVASDSSDDEDDAGNAAGPTEKHKHPASPVTAVVTVPAPTMNRGRLIKGPTRALRDIAHLDSDKVNRIIAQVERNNAEMDRQQQEITRLREFVGHLLSRTDDHQTELTSAEAARRDEIRTHLQKNV